MQIETVLLLLAELVCPVLSRVQHHHRGRPHLRRSLNTVPATSPSSNLTHKPAGAATTISPVQQPEWECWPLNQSRSTSTTTVTVTAYPFDDDSVTTSSSLSTPGSISLENVSSAEQPTVGAYVPVTTLTTSLPVSISSSNETHLTSPTSPSTIDPPQDTCSTEPFNKTDIGPYFGLNVVNQKPTDPVTATEFKKPEDWDAAFKIIKQYFPNTNAVRLYSTTDGGGTFTHLMNAIPAAERHDLKILAGVWSGGPDNTARFKIEKQALQDVIQKFGCKNIAAISVGNEDIYQINVSHAEASEDVKDDLKLKVANALLDQISQIRSLVRGLGCCDVPITHADTATEVTDSTKPWVPQLLRTCDQAIIANIFPYWSQSTIVDSWKMIAEQSYQTLATAREFGKDVWLGETGWATSQPSDIAPYNTAGTDKFKAQKYFDQVGCQVLSGTGTAFYYVDWDEDSPKLKKPAFGLFDHTGQPTLANLDCSKYKPDTRLKDFKLGLPGYMGGSQAQRQVES